MSNKELLRKTFLDLLAKVDPMTLVLENIAYKDKQLTIRNKSFLIDKPITLLGSGKAVLPMAQGIHRVLEDSIKETVLVGQSDYNLNFQNATYLQSSHPVPSSKSIQSAKTLIKTLHQLGEDDFFIYLLSGGNSSLVELPCEGITLDDFQTMTELMLKNALPIEAINCVRKHISQVKGGRLAKLTKAKGIVLVLSDVLGNDLHAIGSAPLYFDGTTYDDAIHYLKKYNIWDQTPLSIQNILLKKEDETPKDLPKNIQHFILGSNETLLKKGKLLLEQHNIKTKLFEQSIDHNVVDLPYLFDKIIQKYEKENVALIYGGEATVQVKRNGRGGRNQHLCLLMTDVVAKHKNVTFLSASSDGRDGNSEASGAIIDSDTKQEAIQQNLSIKQFLSNYDSNLFFKITNNLIETGLTNNNLLDIVIILIENKKENNNG